VFARRGGYDLYRFDRGYHNGSVAGDAKELAAAVQIAKASGYKRVVISGHSIAGWISLDAAVMGAFADGVIAMASAMHGRAERVNYRIRRGGRRPLGATMHNPRHRPRPRSRTRVPA